MRAFEDATENSPFDAPSGETEYQAYKKLFLAHDEAILQHCGNIVGLDKMDRLAKVVFVAGEENTLAEFVNVLCVFSFRIGYKAGKEEKL